MRRRVFALLGITVFLGGSLVLVGLLSSEAPPLTEAPPEVTAAPQGVPDAPPAVAPLASRAPPWAATAARSTSPTQAWKPAKDPSAPGKADRATRKAVRKALLAAPVEGRLTLCVDRDREVWFGGGWTSQEPIPRSKPAILVLDLEPLDRRVRIADAQVKSWGGASRAAVACARDALVGTVVATRSLKPEKPARPMQMTFLLSPRSGALATAQ